MSRENNPEERTPVVEFAVRMRDNWYNFTHNPEYGANELTWEKCPLETLKEMHGQFQNWIQECQAELKVHPSPEGKDNIADDWVNTLTLKSEILASLIAKKDTSQ